LLLVLAPLVEARPPGFHDAPIDAIRPSNMHAIAYATMQFIRTNLTRCTGPFHSQRTRTGSVASARQSSASIVIGYAAPHRGGGCVSVCRKKQQKLLLPPPPSIQLGMALPVHEGETHNSESMTVRRVCGKAPRAFGPRADIRRTWILCVDLRARRRALAIYVASHDAPSGPGWILYQNLYRSIEQR